MTRRIQALSRPTLFPRIGWILLIVSFVANADRAIGAPADSLNSADRDQSEIRGLMVQWQRIVASGDLSQLHEFMAEDAIFLTVGEPPMRGKAAFTESCETAARQFRIRSSVEPKEVQITGNWAYAWSRIHATLSPRKGGDSTRGSGYGLTILHKELNGHWVIARDANMVQFNPHNLALQPKEAAPRAGTSPTLSAQAEANPDRRAILQLEADWRRATANGDWERLESLMSDDAIFLAPGEEPMHKKDFATRFEAIRRGVRIDSNGEPEEINVLGDWAYVLGPLAVTLTPQNGRPVVHRSGYALTIFHKSQRGAWTIARDANLLTAGL